MEQIMIKLRTQWAFDTCYVVTQDIKTDHQENIY